MDKQNPASDSEDEAFESADEGQEDEGPSPLKSSSASTKMEQKTIESVKPTKDDPQSEDEGLKPSVNEAPVKSENNSVKVSTDAEDDTFTSHTRNVLDENTSSESLIENENSKDQPVKSEDQNAKGLEDAKSETENRDDVATEKVVSSEDLSSVDLEAPTIEHGDSQETSEPSIERIHEVPKETNSEIPISQAMDRQATDADEAKQSEPASTAAGGWGWGGWGNMLSKATSSVSSVLETVETQLGIPSPTEMARLATAKIAEHSKPKETEKGTEEETDKESSKDNEASPTGEPSNEEKGLSSWLSGLGVSQISSLVQSTGKEIVAGSLDALEFVGKKTFDALSHGDPGFRRKRMTLSQALRDAKDKAQQRTADTVEEEGVTFSIEFDKFQGLAHLEALEMISHESEVELEKLLELSADESLKDKNEQIEMLREKFKIGENEDDELETEAGAMENFEEVILEQVACLSLSVTPMKIISAYDRSNAKSERQEGETVATEDLFADTINCFAEMTARSVELFHKIGEFMLLPDVKASYLVKARADALRTICNTLRSAVAALSNKFAATLNESAPEKDDKVSKMITDIYLEASNSSAYINDSFHLLLPIFQLSVVKNS